MEQFVDRFVEVVVGYLPTLLIAVLVLVAGWIVAMIGRTATRGILRRTSVDNKLAEWATGSAAGEGPPVESAAARVVYWILIAFTLVAFLTVLGLGTVADPLRSSLDRVFAFLPRLLSAAVLLGLAWIVATGLRFMISRALAATSLDERLGREVGGGSSVAPSRMLAETVFWLVLLLFLPAVLDALGLQGLLAPINELVTQVLAFLPKLFGAAAILGFGWLLAKVAQRIVTSLMGATGADALGDRVGVSKVLGERRLSVLVGLIVYVLILIPIVVMALDTLGLKAVSTPATAMLDRVLAAVPALFGAAIILAVAYLAGRVLAEIVTRLLESVGFDRFLQRIGFRVTDKTAVDAGPTRRPSEIVGWIAMVAIMLFATIEALRMLQFELLAGIVAQFTVFLGNVLLGVIVLAVGLYFGALASNAITTSGTRNAPLLATLARSAILALAGAMALRQAGIAEDIINLAFGLLLGAVAVAAAIAFGIGGREIAARQLERWRSELD
jgi:hypothetical protein